MLINILGCCCYKNFALFHKKLFIHSHAPFFFVLFQARKTTIYKWFPYCLIRNCRRKKMTEMWNDFFLLNRQNNKPFCVYVFPMWWKCNDNNSRSQKPGLWEWYIWMRNGNTGKITSSSVCLTKVFFHQKRGKKIFETIIAETIQFSL